MAEAIPWLFLLPPVLVAIFAALALMQARSKPGKARAALRRGGQHLYSGELEEAEGAFRQGLELQPQNSAILGSLGGLLVSLGRFDEAEEYLKKASELTPKDSSHKMNRAKCLHGQDNQEAAREIWLSIPKEDPHYIEAQGSLAQDHGQQGNWEAAIAALELAIEKGPVHDARPYKKEKRRIQKALDEGKDPAILEKEEKLAKERPTRRSRRK